MNDQYLKEALAIVDALSDEEVAEIRAALDRRSSPSTQRQGEEARDAALEEAALACEAIESDRRDAYKGRGKYERHNPCRADPYVDAVSDGAGQCADAIRNLKRSAHPADAPEGEKR